MAKASPARLGKSKVVTLTTKPKSAAAPPPSEPVRIPAFSLAGSDGRIWKPGELVGRTWVLYFYPKDSTSGCTQQACDFRDRFERLQAKGVPVLGVSPDNLKSHGSFIAKQRLPFVLLSDPEHSLAERLGVWQQKQLYGRSFMGIVRTTFLIGPDGRILRVWRKVKVAGHVDEVLAAAGA